MCNAYSGRKLNLPEIAAKLENVEYNPKRYHPVILRLRHPKCTINIFASGKIVCNGTAHKTDALNACREAVSLIGKVYPCVRCHNFTICNLVYGGSLNKSVDLPNIYKTIMHCIYEPELFPGMKISVPVANVSGNKNNVVILLFHTGKFIITGSSSERDVNYAYSYLLNKVG